MTVAMLRESMTTLELRQWSSFLMLKAERERRRSR